MKLDRDASRKRSRSRDRKDRSGDRDRSKGREWDAGKRDADKPAFSMKPRAEVNKRRAESKDSISSESVPSKDPSPARGKNDRERDSKDSKDSRDRAVSSQDKEKQDNKVTLKPPRER